MESLTTVIRAIRGEVKDRRDHLTVFREFLGHLDRAGRRPPPPRPQKATKPNGKARGSKR